MLSENMKRDFSIPPWTVIVLQLVYLCGFFAAFDTGLAWHSAWHFGMALLSFVLVIGLYFRWRLALWGSVLIFAAAAGGTLAHKLLNLGATILIVQTETLLNIAFLFQVVGVILHQTANTFRWFGIEKVRKMRPWFWLVAVTAFSIWASVIYFGMQGHSEARKVDQHDVSLPNREIGHAHSAFPAQASTLFR